MTEEQYLMEQLHLLRLEYEKIAKPITDRLVQMRSAKPVVPMFFDPEKIDPTVLEILKSDPDFGQ